MLLRLLVSILHVCCSECVLHDAPNYIVVPSIKVSAFALNAGFSQQAARETTDEREKYEHYLPYPLFLSGP